MTRNKNGNSKYYFEVNQLHIPCYSGVNLMVGVARRQKEFNKFVKEDQFCVHYSTGEMAVKQGEKPFYGGAITPG